MSLVVITFLRTATWSSRRALQATESTDINVTVFVPDNAAADRAVQALPTDATAMGSNPAFNGLQVTTYDRPQPRPRSPQLPAVEVAIGAVALLLIVPLILCITATIWSGQKRATGEIDPGGCACCKTGCCSFNAVGPWATGELIVAATLIGFVGFLFVTMTGLTDEIVGVVVTFNSLAASEHEAIRSLLANIPRDVVVTLRDNVEQFRLLPFSVIGPGLVAAALLLLASLCSSLNANRGSYCWSKCMMLSAKVFLLLSLVFYAIFASFAVALTYAPPGVAVQINTVRGICVTVPASMLQLVADNTAAIEQLRTSGQNVTELATTLAEVQQLVVQVDTGCDHLDGVFDETFVVFLPSMLCVLAIAAALFVNQALCCAAGCCDAPPQAPADKAKPDFNSIQFETFTTRP